METVVPFQVTIPSYKEIPDGKKKVVYFSIEVLKKGADKWVIDKRFREFDELHATLKKTHAHLPVLPGKTVFALKESTILDKRRQDLEAYLQSLIARTDLLSSDSVKRFLQIDSFAPEATVTPPKLLGEVAGIVLGVRDFHYEHKEGLLFTAISDMSVTSRVDSYLTNMKMPWEKELPTGGMVTVGAVECYIQKDKDEINFDKVWTKTFQSQVIHLHWEPTSCLLTCGKDDGSVTILKVSSELNYIKYDEVISTKNHLQRVMGVYVDPITQYCYTISEDKKFKVFDVNKNNVVADISCGNNMLSALDVDKDNKRMFISNRSGQIFIYDYSTKEPKLLHTIQAHGKGGNIRGLNFDSYKNYLFTANYDDGVITIHDLHKPGKEKFASNIANLHGKTKVRSCVWSTGRYELYTGNEDGTLTFWDAKKVSPLYVLKAHTEGICKLEWIESKGWLLSAGKDKKLRFYEIPNEWRDKRLEAELLKEAKINKQTEIMVESKKKIQKAQEDSDEDDLIGWHK
jgi:WD40 repeat protein